MILSSGGQGGQASAKGESAGLTGAAGDGTARSSSVLLFNLSGTTMAPAGALTVVEQGQSLKASPAASEVSSIPSLNQASMRFVSVDYRLPSGTQNQVTVGVSPDGMLMVKVPAGVKATMDDRSIVLIGMAIAKERLDVQPSNVKGVVIQVGE